MALRSIGGVKNVLIACYPPIRASMIGFPQLRREAVIFDLEFTAWEGSMGRRWMAPGEFTEIVQIGAVRVDGETLEETESFEILVRPRINPVLSPYLERLTGVTNGKLAERGVDFAEAYSRFMAFADGSTVFAFGRDDLIIESNLRLYGMAASAPRLAYADIIPFLENCGIDVRGAHACDVARLAGAEFKGRDHDALDDARSVAAGLKALIPRGARTFLSGAANRR